MTKIENFNIDVLRICNWDFEKASKLQTLKNKMTNDEFDLLIENFNAYDELSVGTVNEERLNRIKKLTDHFKKYHKQYATLATFTIFILLGGVDQYAKGVLTFAPVLTKYAPVLEVKTACASAIPTISTGNITDTLNTLITNLLKFGVLGIGASTAFEMTKTIIEGNKSKMPKILINNALMMGCLLLSPTVFNKISEAFNMGKVIGQCIFNILA